MGNNLTTVDHSGALDNTVIRYSIATLAAGIPTWVDLGALAAIVPHGYGRELPADSAPALREAAANYQLALGPSSSGERQRVLMGLRSATMLRDEHVDEADATLKLLRVHLGDVPLDILETACRDYCNAPGKRFFPKSAGELRTYIQPLLFERQARAYHLRKLADEAERADAERERLAGDPLTVEEMRAIIAEAKLSARMAKLITPGQDRAAA